MDSHDQDIVQTKRQEARKKLLASQPKELLTNDYVFYYLYNSKKEMYYTPLVISWSHLN
uniref:Uncharacterized protein n=1 Tax=Rhizophora mucronata TaxID=61149 RepID=A0A2P2N6L4_RHIMU